jgi:hypothetical protein
MRLWSDCSHMKTKVAATNACGNTPSSVQACDRGSRPTSTPSRPYGRNRQDGLRTAPRRRRTTGTRPVRLTCGAAFGLRVCSPPGLILGQLRMPHSPGTNRGLASALLSLTPATASMRSTATSCCGTWPTVGIGGADSRSTRNRYWYWHWVRCLVRSEPGEPALVIHSKEGITQGDCLAVLMPLASMMHAAIPEALQPWYCNDAGAAGKALPNAQCLDFLVKFGLAYGYFSEPGKLYNICKAEDEPVARRSRLTTRRGSGTWAASFGAPRRKRSG